MARTPFKILFFLMILGGLSLTSRSYSQFIPYDSKEYQREQVQKFIQEQRNLKDPKVYTQRFIQFMAPLAVRMQDETGLPASIIIAQAAIETQWGRSPVFFDHMNFSGQSYFHPEDQKTIDVPFEGKTYKITYTRGAKRKDEKSGSYRNYPNLEMAALGHIHNLLLNPDTQKAYADIRTALATTPKHTVAPRETILEALSSYASDKSYPDKVREIIRKYRIESFDKQTYFQQSTPKSTPSVQSNEKTYKVLHQFVFQYKNDAGAIEDMVVPAGSYITPTEFPPNYNWDWAKGKAQPIQVLALYDSDTNSYSSPDEENQHTWFLPSDQFTTEFLKEDPLPESFVSDSDESSEHEEHNHTARRLTGHYYELLGKDMIRAEFLPKGATDTVKLPLYPGSLIELASPGEKGLWDWGNEKAVPIRITAPVRQGKVQPNPYPDDIWYISKSEFTSDHFQEVSDDDRLIKMMDLAFEANKKAEACPPTKEPQTTQPGAKTPRAANAFSYRAAGKSVHHPGGHVEPLALWDQCQGRVKGNYEGENDDGDLVRHACGPREISKPFIDFLNKNFESCVASGLEKIGGIKTADVNSLNQTVIIDHGIIGDSVHSPRSNHSVLRAIDIAELQINYTSKDGKIVLFTTNYAKSYEEYKAGKKNTANVLFWNEFETCWASKVQAANAKCSNAQRGVIGWENTKHRHHAHVSLPFCPRTQGKTKFMNDKDDDYVDRKK